jgi:hypothetical protein
MKKTLNVNKNSYLMFFMPFGRQDIEGASCDDQHMTLNQSKVGQAAGLSY